MRGVGPEVLVEGERANVVEGGREGVDGPLARPRDRLGNEDTRRVRIDGDGAETGPSLGTDAGLSDDGPPLPVDGDDLTPRRERDVDPRPVGADRDSLGLGGIGHLDDRDACTRGDVDGCEARVITCRDPRHPLIDSDAPRLIAYGDFEDALMGVGVEDGDRVRIGVDDHDATALDIDRDGARVRWRSEEWLVDDVEAGTCHLVGPSAHPQGDGVASRLLVGVTHRGVPAQVTSITELPCVLVHGVSGRGEPHRRPDLRREGVGDPTVETRDIRSRREHRAKGLGDRIADEIRDTARRDDDFVRGVGLQRHGRAEGHQRPRVAERAHQRLGFAEAPNDERGIVRALDRDLVRERNADSCREPDRRAAARRIDVGDGRRDVVPRSTLHSEYRAETKLVIAEDDQIADRQHELVIDLRDIPSQDLVKQLKFARGWECVDVDAGAGTLAAEVEPPVAEVHVLRFDARVRTEKCDLSWVTRDVVGAKWIDEIDRAAKESADIRGLLGNDGVQERRRRRVRDVQRRNARARLWSRDDE